MSYEINVGAWERCIDIDARRCVVTCENEATVAIIFGDELIDPPLRPLEVARVFDDSKVDRFRRRQRIVALVLERTHAAMMKVWAAAHGCTA